MIGSNLPVLVESENMQSEIKVTIELLRVLCPKTKVTVLEKYADALDTIAKYYEFNKTPQRLAAFLSQIAHESGGFNAVKENLNYSAKGLMTTFKKYFPDEATAKQYERKPEKIANRVYANRMKNGNEASGDGYKFCGRGLIQLTGRDNYTRLAEALDLSIEDTVQYLETPEGAVSSAGWFFDFNDLMKYCEDFKDYVTLTKKINGGTNGIEDRIHHYEVVLKYLKSQHTS